MKVGHPERAWKTGGCRHQQPGWKLRMNIHKNARATPHRRLLMVRWVIDAKQPRQKVAADFGVSVETVGKWVRRWRAGGEPALHESTVGAAKDPSDQTETTVDDAVQASAWRALLDAALDARDGVGSALYGMLVWRWPPVADAEATGFNVQNKPAAAVIAEGWSRARP